MGKGEIARYEQFLLFPQCFQKTKRLVLQTRKNQGLFGKGLNVSGVGGKVGFSFSRKANLQSQGDR